MNNLPAVVSERGLDNAQWNTLKYSIYPGAADDSIVMAIDYCRAAKLDPLKKPVHIVPMRRQLPDGTWGYVDQILPGIYMYRTTAHRTGEYCGHTEPNYGPEIEVDGVAVPEWCSITVYRYNAKLKDKVGYTVKTYFVEVCGTAFDQNSKRHVINARWSKAPRQMLTKCTEAAALREAFPDELGGLVTDDEVNNEQPDYIQAENIQKESARPAIQQMSQAAFEKNLPKYREIILSGKRTAQELINVLSTKVLLTDQMKEDIEKIGSQDAQETNENQEQNSEDA